MIDDRVQGVLQQGPDRSLDRLEADIWAGVAVCAEVRRTRTFLAGAQLAVTAVALVGSLTVGSAAVATREREHNTFALLSSADLAPSTLLIGR